MPESPLNPGSDVETALLDAELFIKYRAPERAIKRLRTALERSPRSIILRERLRDIAAGQNHLDEAARQCLALASLHIERQEFDSAHDCLLEAKHFDSRINITAGLEAIRRARHPTSATAKPAEPPAEPPKHTLAGDLSSISVFDAIQVIENAKLTGALTLLGQGQAAAIFFNDGRIVDSDCGNVKGEPGFRDAIEITSGSFQFEKSASTYPIKIQALSNTNLILDSLRQADEEKV